MVDLTSPSTLAELRHTHTHLTMDCDLTQSGHCHTGQHGTVSNLAISDISRHLWTGRDSTLTAHTPHSATSSLTYFLIQLIILMYIHCKQDKVVTTPGYDM